MSARPDAPIVAAVLAEVRTIDQTLVMMHAPAASHDDLRQTATIAAWKAACRGGLEWWAPRAVRRFLHVTTARAVYDWFDRNPHRDELLEEHEPAVPSAEQRYLGKEALAFLRRATTPQRWKTIAAYAKGIPASAIAQREGIPVPTVYDRIRRARLDMRAALAREDAAVYLRRKK